MDWYHGVPSEVEQVACGRLRHQVVKCCGVESIEFFVSDVENSMDFFANFV